jgi:hypothetical protein
MREGLDEHCLRCSRAACYKGDPAGDPAIHSDGRIKPECNLSHFRPELHVDANHVDCCKDPLVDVKQKDMRSRGGIIFKMAGASVISRSKKHTLMLTSKITAEKTAKKQQQANVELKLDSKKISREDDDWIEMDMIALHTQESEYITMSNGAQIGRKVINLMTEFGFSNKDFAVPMFEDNASCAKLATRQINRSNGKHIHLCYHHVKLMIEQGVFVVYKIGDPDQVADILTKALHVKKFDYLSKCMRGIDIRDMTTVSTKMG